MIKRPIRHDYNKIQLHNSEMQGKEQTVQQFDNQQCSLKYLTAAGTKVLLNRSLEHRGIIKRSLKEPLKTLCSGWPSKNITIFNFDLILFSTMTSSESGIRPITEPALLISLFILFLSSTDKLPPSKEQHKKEH